MKNWNISYFLTLEKECTKKKEADFSIQNSFQISVNIQRATILLSRVLRHSEMLWYIRCYDIASRTLKEL